MSCSVQFVGRWANKMVNWLVKRGWLPAGESNDGERDL